jgi:hypothetical protein
MTSAGDSSLFQQYFGAQRYSEFPWYGGCFPAQHSPAGHSGNNSNSFQLFSACGMNMIFLHLECNAPDDVLAWANALLQKYKNRPAFITSHMGWGPGSKPTEADQYFATAPKGRMRWTKIHEGRGNSPQQMWEKCYQHHPNLVAVFSGDQSRTQAFRRRDLQAAERQHRSRISTGLWQWLAAFIQMLPGYRRN